MSTSARMLQLLSLLQTHRYWPGRELADRLEVSPRTLRRDIERLRDLGYPVDAERGVAGGYQLAAGAALPPLVIDDEEAVAIAVGLQAAAQGAITGIGESAVQALAKVMQVLPPRLQRRVDALRAMTVPARWDGASSSGSSDGRGGWSTVDARTLTTLAQACRDDERVRFTYTSKDGPQTAREVEPHRLVPLGRRWYLVAYDLTRHDWRSFRLDRLAGPERTGDRYRPRPLPAEDAAAFVRAGLGRTASRYAVDVVVQAPAAKVSAYVGRWGSVEEIDDDHCRLRMDTDVLDWPAMALGAVGADFDVVSPPELVEYVGAWGRRFARAAAAGARPAP
jgi:predicted DNA-binding transcriptional regulator YafY